MDQFILTKSDKLTNEANNNSQNSNSLANPKNNKSDHLYNFENRHKSKLSTIIRKKTSMLLEEFSTYKISTQAKSKVKHLDLIQCKQVFLFIIKMIDAMISVLSILIYIISTYYLEGNRYTKHLL